MTIPIDVNPDQKTLRQFGGLCLIVFGGVALAGYSKSGLNSFNIAWAAAGLFGGACGWLRPELLRWVFVTWIILVFPIGWTVTKILLTVMYFGVFTPIGCLLRLAGKDALRLKRPPAGSCWQNRPVTAELKRYFRQY